MDNFIFSLNRKILKGYNLLGSQALFYALSFSTLLRSPTLHLIFLFVSPSLTTIYSLLH